MLVRFKMAKEGLARFLSHLDTVRVVERALRRAGLPVAYSQGFNPHPRISFGPALAVGIASSGEYFDVEFDSRVDVELAAEVLERQMPRGFSIKGFGGVPTGAASLGSIIQLAGYTVQCPYSVENRVPVFKLLVQDFLEKSEINVSRTTKKGMRVKDIRQGIHSLTVDQREGTAVFSMVIETGPTGSIKPREVLQAFSEAYSLQLETDGAYVRRTDLLIPAYGGYVTPLDVLGQFGERTVQ